MSVKDLDSHKLSLHPDRLTEWMKNDSCYPLHVEIGVTNRCNHKCVFCTLDWINHGKKDINTNSLLKSFDDMKDIGVKSIYFAGEGEPLLHKDLSKFIDRLTELNIKTALSSNGSSLNDTISRSLVKNLSWIRFSIDASTPETYSKIHKVSTKEFKKVIKNIGNLVNIKHKLNSNINIGIQAITMPENINELEDLCKISKAIGVDNFQVKPAHNHPNSSFTPKSYKFSRDSLKDVLERYESEDFIVVVRVKSMERLEEERNYKKCHGFNFYSLIDAYGNVTPCNIFYRSKDFIYGNINDNTFKNILDSDRKKTIISNIEKLKFSLCGNYRCRLDVMNRYLERLINPEENDEFI